MIDLNATLAELEGPEERTVRLYHAKRAGYWIAQQFADDTMAGKALSSGQGKTPEDALAALRLDAGLGAAEGLSTALSGLTATLRRIKL